MMVQGKIIPANMVIDHKNGDHADNRFENLRLATRQENGFNSKQQVKSIFKGAWFDSSKNAYQAYVNKNGKRFRLGYFSELRDAIKAVKMARNALHGRFARHGRAL